MKIFQKRFKIIFVFLVIFYFTTCSEPSKSGSQESSDGRTYLSIVNNTPYAVNVYINDPPIYSMVEDTIRNVPAGSSQQWELQPTLEGNNGETLYFEYLIPIGSTVIPTYPNNAEYVKVKKLQAGMVNTQEVPVLSSVQTNSIFVLVTNNSNDSIWFQQGIYTRKPYGYSENSILPGDDAIFVFDDISSLSNCTIGSLTRHNFPNTPLTKGNVYSFRYDGRRAPALLLIEPFDPDMQTHIWTIPTYVEPITQGRLFTVGLLSSRHNPKTNGYILAGRVSFNLDSIYYPHIYGSIPYLGMITPTGTITERRISLKQNPSGMYIRDFIEDSSELIYTGQVFYDGYPGFPFILGTDSNGTENFYYENFVEDLGSASEIHGYKLAKWGYGSFAIGCNLWEYTNDWHTQIYIAKVSKTSWDKVTHAEFWKSPLNDNAKIVDLIYDQNHNIIVVVAETNTGSAVYFIDADTGSIKYNTVKINDYWINGFFSVGDQYYIAGAYIGIRDRAFITTINVITGSVNTMNPWLIDPVGHTSGAAGIYNVLLESDGNLILAGWCQEYSGISKIKPWLIKYNLNEREIIWEQIYNDHEGYYIYSIHNNAIGSYLLEIFNETNYHSYLISTDLLGKMSSSNVLSTLPRNANLFNVPAPGTPSLGISLTPLVDAALSTPAVLTIPKGQTGTITVQGSWTSYQWFIDGSLVSGSSSNYQFNSQGRDVGIYTVTVVVTNSQQEKRSASCKVTVRN